MRLSDRSVEHVQHPWGVSPRYSVSIGLASDRSSVTSKPRDIVHPGLSLGWLVTFRDQLFTSGWPQT